MNSIWVGLWLAVFILVLVAGKGRLKRVGNETMGGHRFIVRFCCNAGQVRRTLVEQQSTDELLRKGDGGSLLQQIAVAVQTGDFVKIIDEFTGDKIDVIVTCAGGRVVSVPLIKMVP